MAEEAIAAAMADGGADAAGAGAAGAGADAVSAAAPSLVNTGAVSPSIFPTSDPGPSIFNPGGSIQAPNGMTTPPPAQPQNHMASVIQNLMNGKGGGSSGGGAGGGDPPPMGTPGPSPMVGGMSPLQAPALPGGGPTIQPGHVMFGQGGKPFAYQGGHPAAQSSWSPMRVQ